MTEDTIMTIKLLQVINTLAIFMSSDGLAALEQGIGVRFQVGASFCAFS